MSALKSMLKRALVVAFNREIEMQFKGGELGVAEIAGLLDLTADEKALDLHYESLHPDALPALLDFVANCRCQVLTIYFENLTLVVANQLYRAATLNTAVEAMKLDLEVLLAFMSKKALDYAKAQDIAEHFHSEVYQKVHTLIIDYPEMNLTQAHLITQGIKASRATEDANLYKLLIICPNLPENIKDHWRLQLESCHYLEATFYESSAHFSIATNLSALPEDNLSLIINVPALPEEAPAISFREERAEGCFNFSECLASLLTWVWNRSSAIEPAREEHTYYARPSYHRKSS